MDYVMRPVLKGMCQYESMKNGMCDLADVAEMNDALDVMQENERRAYEAMKQQ